MFVCDRCREQLPPLIIKYHYGINSIQLSHVDCCKPCSQLLEKMMIKTLLNWKNGAAEPCHHDADSSERS